MNNHPIATILGGGGFIGRYLVRNLSKNNYRCFIPTRKPYLKGYLKTQSTPGAVELFELNSNNYFKLEESIKNIGGAIDESTPYMDNYCHQINFKINEKEYTIDLTDMDIVNTYNV